MFLLLNRFYFLCDLNGALETKVTVHQDRVVTHFDALPTVPKN